MASVGTWSHSGDLSSECEKISKYIEIIRRHIESISRYIEILTRLFGNKYGGGFPNTLLYYTDL